MAKINKQIVTSKGTFTISINQEKYLSSSDKNYGDETPFTIAEMKALRESVSSYPAGGLGECLIAANNSRGFKRHPNYSKFTNMPAPLDSVRCPVLVLKEDFAESISFKEHLRQYRRIRNHIASELNISLKDARYFYNYMLANDPKKLAELL